MASRTVSVALVADVGQYQSAMVRAASSTKAVGTSATTAGTQAQRGFEAAGRGATILTAVLAGGVALGLKSVVNAAADAEQSVGGVGAVFKDYARTVVASSEEADRALGLSANSYRELATIIGSQMKNAGVPLDELADKTEDIIGIGADLAAQFGGSTQQAVEALSSAFRGELDPIERYGISLTAAAVGAKAVEMGLAESATELSQNAKAMATLAIITEQSADAQGAFSREADTAAGRAQRAAASWENLKVAVGDRLLPVWSSLVDVLGEDVIPALGQVLTVGGDVVSFIGEHKEIALALAGVLAVQLAGGITAVTVAFNRMVLTPVVLGLSGILGVALNLPAAFAAATSAVAGFAAAVAPLVAVGAVVYAIAKTVDFATAAGDAREEIRTMWAAVEDARGAEQLSAAGGLVDQLRTKVQSLNEELPKTEGAFQGFLSMTGMLENGGTLEALDEYEDALLRAQAQQERVEASADRLAGKFGLTRDQVLDLASKYDIDLTGSMSETFRLMQNYYAMEFGTKPTEATIAVTDAFEGAKEAVDAAKQSVDNFKLSLDILTGAHVSMIQVESAFEAAIDAADGALKDMNGSVLDGAGNLNMQSESGRAAADVLLDVRDSGNQLIATMIQQGASTDEVRAKDAQLRESFIRSAEQMGISRRAAEVLADQILGIPAERETRIDADTAAARAAISQVQTDINNLTGRQVFIDVAARTGRTVAQVEYLFNKQNFADGGYTGDGGKYEPKGVVHGGEYVFTKEQTARLGVNRLEALANGGVPGFANGGPVPINLTLRSDAYQNTLNGLAKKVGQAAVDVSSGVAGSGSLSGAWGSIWQYVKSRVPAARINSTFRAGDPGYHGRGKAIDFGYGSGPGGAGSAGLALINRVLHDGVGRNLAELIYDGIGDDRPDLKNGRPLTYSAATRAAHRNHVHAAVYDQGGPLYPGYTLAYNGTGKTEWVSKEIGGGSGGGGVSVAAPNVNVFVEVDGQQLRHVARVEAEGVVVSAFTGSTERGRFNG